MTRVRREDAARPGKAGPAVRGGPGADGDEASGEAVRPDPAAGRADARPGAGSAEPLATTVNPDAPGASHESDAGEGEQAAADDAPEDAPLDVEALGRDLPEAPRGAEDRERDRELVGLAQKGDRQAFRQLFERHHKRAYAVAYGVLKNKQDALDVVQDAFVKVHRHLDSFQGSSSFYTWLYRIVMNLAIDQLRRRKTARPVEYDDTALREGELEDSILPRMLESNPRKTVIRRELMARVEAALATLPEYHRQVIVLREIEGLSYEEMAEVLEVPKGTIMSRLFHARRKMQAALQDFVEGGDLDVEE